MRGAMVGSAVCGGLYGGGGSVGIGIGIGIGGGCMGIMEVYHGLEIAVG